VSLLKSLANRSQICLLSNYLSLTVVRGNVIILQVLCLNHNHVESILPKAKPQPAQARGKTSSTNLSVVTAMPDGCDALLPNLEVLCLGSVVQQSAMFSNCFYSPVLLCIIMRGTFLLHSTIAKHGKCCHNFVFLLICLQAVAFNSCVKIAVLVM